MYFVAGVCCHVRVWVSRASKHETGLMCPVLWGPPGLGMSTWGYVEGAAAAMKDWLYKDLVK